MRPPEEVVDRFAELNTVAGIAVRHIHAIREAQFPVLGKATLKTGAPWLDQRVQVAAEQRLSSTDYDQFCALVGAGEFCFQAMEQGQAGAEVRKLARTTAKQLHQFSRAHLGMEISLPLGGRGLGP